MSNTNFPFVNELFDAGPGALDPRQKAEIAATIRAQSLEVSHKLDVCLFEKLNAKTLGLKEAQAQQKNFKKALEEITAPPWFFGIFVRLIDTVQGRRALVAQGNVHRVVGVSEDLVSEDLACGDAVLLSNQLNLITAKYPEGGPRGGETAIFDRRIDRNRIVIKTHLGEEEFVVEAAGALLDENLKTGDRVIWDKSYRMAFEKIESSQGEDLLLEETPKESFNDIGGLHEQIQQMLNTIDLFIHYKEITSKYHLRRKRGGLLVGPPGTGKTLMARAFANWLAQQSKSGRAGFINIKPGEFNNLYFGQSEANIRETFRRAKKLSQQEPDVPIVMFFDEIDAIGATRGETLMRVHDRVLQAFMVELDGLVDTQGDIFVLAATNRRDALDPALLRPGRLGDIILEFPQPNRSAAQEIFEKHLPEDIPYYVNGHDNDPAAVRQEIIDTAVSCIYAPNGNGQLATIVLRDGKRRLVKAADLVSGALIAKITLAARMRACIREIKTGNSGLQLNDVMNTVSQEFDTVARVLTPRNCRNYITDLPQDSDVVSVTPYVRRVSQPYEYLNLNVA